MEVSGQFHTPAALPPSIHCVGGWMGPTADLNAAVQTKIPCLRWEPNPDSPASSLSLHRLNFIGPGA
jgi:hypothetical protein